MPRTHDDDDDDIVADGTVVHVPFYDSARGRFGPETVASGYIRDNRPGGPWSPPDRRPVLTDAAALADARQRLQREYQLYDARDARAWERPPNGPGEYNGSQPLNTGAGAPGRGRQRIPAGAYPRGPGYQEGDECTINGQSGRLVRQGDWLVCRPTNSNDARRLIKQSHYDPMGRLEGTSHYEYEDEPDESEDGLDLGDAMRRLQSARQQAYDAYDREAAEAWKDPK
jgi:hypothetical protein